MADAVSAAEVTTTLAGPSRRAAASTSLGEAGEVPVSQPSSKRFGVATSARGSNRLRMAAAAASGVLVARRMNRFNLISVLKTRD